ncbi:MAG TPA: hypothetical protein PLV31_05955 [Gammaproteobacteria bacterium]|nr:hypothetical protein [Gammaproteobacteria bacterium]HRA43207.1 hypothetical protein [Gammaproteobacteria bacterium]
MKLKKFDDYLKKRLVSDEIAAIERQAGMEFELLKAFQEDVSRVISDYQQPCKAKFIP